MFNNFSQSSTGTALAAAGAVASSVAIFYKRRAIAEKVTDVAQVTSDTVSNAIASTANAVNTTVDTLTSVNKAVKSATTFQSTIKDFVESTKNNVSFFTSPIGSWAASSIPVWQCSDANLIAANNFNDGIVDVVLVAPGVSPIKYIQYGKAEKQKLNYFGRVLKDINIYDCSVRSDSDLSYSQWLTIAAADAGGEFIAVDDSVPSVLYCRSAAVDSAAEVYAVANFTLTELGISLPRIHAVKFLSAIFSVGTGIDIPVDLKDTPASLIAKALTSMTPSALNEANPKQQKKAYFTRILLVFAEAFDESFAHTVLSGIGLALVKIDQLNYIGPLGELARAGFIRCYPDTNNQIAYAHSLKADPAFTLIFTSILYHALSNMMDFKSDASQDQTATVAPPSIEASPPAKVETFVVSSAESEPHYLRATYDKIKNIFASRFSQEEETLANSVLPASLYEKEQTTQNSSEPGFTHQSYTRTVIKKLQALVKKGFITPSAVDDPAVVSYLRAMDMARTNDLIRRLESTADGSIDDDDEAMDGPSFFRYISGAVHPSQAPASASAPAAKTSWASITPEFIANPSERVSDSTAAAIKLARDLHVENNPTLIKAIATNLVDFKFNTKTLEYLLDDGYIGDSLKRLLVRTEINNAERSALENYASLSKNQELKLAAKIHDSAISTADYKDFTEDQMCNGDDRGGKGKGVIKTDAALAKGQTKQSLISTIIQTHLSARRSHATSRRTARQAASSGGGGGGVGVGHSGKPQLENPIDQHFYDDEDDEFANQSAMSRRIAISDAVAEEFFHQGATTWAVTSARPPQLLSFTVNYTVDGTTTTTTVNALPTLTQALGSRKWLAVPLDAFVPLLHGTDTRTIEASLKHNLSICSYTAHSDPEFDRIYSYPNVSVHGKNINPDTVIFDIIGYGPKNFVGVVLIPPPVASCKLTYTPVRQFPQGSSIATAHYRFGKPFPLPAHMDRHHTYTGTLTHNALTQAGDCGSVFIHEGVPIGMHVGMHEIRARDGNNVGAFSVAIAFPSNWRCFAPSLTFVTQGATSSKPAVPPPKPKEQLDDDKESQNGSTVPTLDQLTTSVLSAHRNFTQQEINRWVACTSQSLVPSSEWPHVVTKKEEEQTSSSSSSIGMLWANASSFRTQASNALTTPSSSSIVDSLSSYVPKGATATESEVKYIFDTPSSCMVFSEPCRWEKCMNDYIRNAGYPQSAPLNRLGMRPFNYPFDDVVVSRNDGKPTYSDPHQITSTHILVPASPIIAMIEEQRAINKLPVDADLRRRVVSEFTTKWDEARAAYHLARKAEPGKREYLKFNKTFRNDSSKRRILWLAAACELAKTTGAGFLYETFGVTAPNGPKNKAHFWASVLKDLPTLTKFLDRVESLFRAMNGALANTVFPVSLYVKRESTKISKFADGKGRTIKEPYWLLSIIQFAMTSLICVDKMPSFSDIVARISKHDFTKPFFVEEIAFATIDDIFTYASFSNYNTYKKGKEFGSVVGKDIVKTLAKLVADPAQFGEKTICFSGDVAKWDKSLDIDLIIAMFTVIFDDVNYGKNFALGMNQHALLNMQGYLFRMMSVSWCSGNLATLTGNSLIHDGITSVICNEIRRQYKLPAYALVVGDDFVIIIPTTQDVDEEIKKQIASLIRKHYLLLGFELKLLEQTLGSFDFCSMLVDTKGPQVDLARIVIKMAANRSLSLPSIKQLYHASINPAWNKAARDTVTAAYGEPFTQALTQYLEAEPTALVGEFKKELAPGQAAQFLFNSTAAHIYGQYPEEVFAALTAQNIFHGLTLKGEEEKPSAASASAEPATAAAVASVA